MNRVRMLSGNERYKELASELKTKEAVRAKEYNK